MNSSFRFRADLAETPLPEVLAIVEGAGAIGVLEVTRDGMVKRVHVERGYVVHASSSDPIDRLSEHIRRAGLLDEALIEALDRERSNSSKRLGVLLVERGLLAPRQVYEAICGQIERIVWSLFAWRNGEVVFEPGEIRDTDAVRVKLPMRRVAFEGIKRAPRIEPPQAIGEATAWRDGERVLEPLYRYEDLIDIGVDAVEMKLLDLVDGHRTLQEVCAGSSLSLAEAVRRLHAFEVLSLLRDRSPGDVVDVAVMGAAPDIPIPS